MALETNKSISLTGKIMVGDTQVGYLSATIDQQGNGANSVNQFIQNQTLYDANKKEVRKDIADFQQLIYDTEDQLDAEKAKAGQDATQTDPATK